MKPDFFDYLIVIGVGLAMLGFGLFCFFGAIRGILGMFAVLP